MVLSFFLPPSRLNISLQDISLPVVIMSNHGGLTANNTQDAQDKQKGFFGLLGKLVPYFRNPKHVLLLKLDVVLLLWMFVAGVGHEKT